MSLFAVSLGIGLSAGLSTVLLAMAIASDPKQGEEQELADDYRGSSTEWVGLSERMGASSKASSSFATGTDNIFVTALVCGQATGAVIVVCLWMVVKAAGQGNLHYMESRTAVLNGGRLELMLAAGGCIFGAYMCARVCAGRFDDNSKTHTDPEAEAELVKILRPFGLALMLNPMCSTVLFPKLMDSAPSKYGTSPDWLATDLTLLYLLKLI